MITVITMLISLTECAGVPKAHKVALVVPRFFIKNKTIAVFVFDRSESPTFLLIALNVLSMLLRLW